MKYNTKIRKIASWLLKNISKIDKLLTRLVRKKKKKKKTEIVSLRNGRENISPRIRQPFVNRNIMKCLCLRN